MWLFKRYSKKTETVTFESVSNLFVACVVCFQDAWYTLYLEENHRHLIYRLYLIALTLARWGYSKGFMHGATSRVMGAEELAQYSQCLRRIEDHFKQAKLGSSKFERANRNSMHTDTVRILDGGEYTPAERAFRVSVSLALIRYTTQHDGARNQEYQSIIPMVVGVVPSFSLRHPLYKTPWTIYSHGALETLVSVISVELGHLMKLFPERVAVPTKTLIQEEVRKAQGGLLRLLRELNDYDMKDEELRQAITAEIDRRGRADISPSRSATRRIAELSHEAGDDFDNDDISLAQTLGIGATFGRLPVDDLSLRILDTSRSHWGKSNSSQFGGETHNAGNLDEDVEEDDEESADSRGRSSGTHPIRKNIRKKYGSLRIPDSVSESLENYKDMAARYRREGRWEEAVRWERIVLRKSAASFGNDDPRTLASMIHLSSIIKALPIGKDYTNRVAETDSLEHQVQASAEALMQKIKSAHVNVAGMDALVSAYRSHQRWSEAIFIEEHQLMHGKSLIQDERLAIFLVENHSLRSAYLQALQELGTERFFAFNDQALSEFFANLRLESWKMGIESGSIYQALHIPKSQARRFQISKWMVQLIKMDPKMLQNELKHKTLPEFYPRLEWIAQTKSLEMLERCIASIIHPVSTIESALQYRTFETIRKLLETRFDSVAQNEYKWLRELSEVGYSCSDISELLYEQAVYAPWIVFEPFEPKTLKEAPIDVNLHLHGCIHKYTETVSTQSGCSNRSAVHHQFDLTIPSDLPPEFLSSQNICDIKEMIERLCGLAGVTPSSRERLGWDGFAEFNEQNSVATIFFEELSDTWEPPRLLCMRNCLERLRFAVANAQAADLCCESFTIIRLPHSDHEPNSNKNLTAEVCRVPLRLVDNLLDHLNDLFGSEKSAIRSAAWTVLQFVIQEAGECPFSREGDIVQICALATQILCFGFLSYIHAHVGPVRPCFLDTPIKKVQLLGISSSLQKSTTRLDGIYIEASLQNLTCFSGVVQSPVFVFRMMESDFSKRGSTHTVSESLEPSLHPVEEQRCDILATLEDLIDTWGPAHFLISPEDNLPFAVKIGCGIIYSENAQTDKLHWSRDVSLQEVVGTSLDLSKKYLIGTRVTVNDRCNISEIQMCRQNLAPYLMPLDTYRSFWRQQERQFGFQGGQYFNIQGTVTAHKLPGRTLKEKIIDRDEILMTDLDDLWGVQVSFCTHVARRVSLREMIADLLPVFAEGSSTFCDQESWKELKNFNIVDIFQKGDIDQFMGRLGEPLKQKVWKMVRAILKTVQPTGLDREKKYFAVAWPHKEGVDDCFRIRLKDKNSWIQVLADCEDSAAFCYITPKCLETDKHKCKGQKQVWNIEMVLLETAVMAYGQDRAALAAMLTHGQVCHFQMMNDIFKVRVQRPVFNGVVNLITERSLVPPGLRVRLMNRSQARLREIKKREDPAEEVVISYLPIPAS